MWTWVQQVFYFSPSLPVAAPPNDRRWASFPASARCGLSCPFSFHFPSALRPSGLTLATRSVTTCQQPERSSGTCHYRRVSCLSSIPMLRCRVSRKGNITVSPRLQKKKISRFAFGHARRKPMADVSSRAQGCLGRLATRQSLAGRNLLAGVRCLTQLAPFAGCLHHNRTAVKSPSGY